jgi:hypothetical protein
MSDGSLEIISLGDRRDFLGSPVKRRGYGSSALPLEPDRKNRRRQNVWMSVDGVLVNAAGPVDNPDVSAASRTAMFSLSSTSLSSSSALDAFGISVFVSLDEGQCNSVDDLHQVRDENRPTFVTQTPCKRRDTLPSVTPHALTHSVRATKHFSTPLAKLDNVDVSHVRTATSISSMAYELRMGLFADGRSISAFENILSLLDQASPTSIPPHRDAMQPVQAS